MKQMKEIVFNGTFRPYQQKVLDSIKKSLKNGKVHIVAAPGSGKTILGLEIVRQLGKPALILSPTIAIREQWGERFAEMFLPAGGNVRDYVSCSLNKPQLLTSITYQGLYSSWRRVADAPKTEDDGDEPDAEIENYSGVNILEIMKANKISTLCLDEAHHLRAEWQKALTEFVAQVEHDVTIVALTATPPYDSKKSEWEKYISVCGPIDEEIFVPELIRTKTLCPHQDYIYYNFPTEDETKLIENYRKNVDETVAAVLAEGRFLEIIAGSDFYKDPQEFEDELLEREDLVRAIAAFVEQCGHEPEKRLLKILERKNRETQWDLNAAQLLFQSMIKDDMLFSVKDRDEVKGYLSRHGLVEKGQVCLITNDELEKLLFSSIGKLNSIDKIVNEEYKNLGGNIRLLILTDYIRATSAVLGSGKEIKEMGVVPIFELLRRKNTGMKLAAISGKIVIVPTAAVNEITEIANKDGARMKVIPIKNTEHSELRFDGAGSAAKIAVITKAFNAGIINAIVGTKSLLGEGWDSPVINTLILGSTVGSFMLSNQMRGRAIRVDKYKPEKVSNIWHLTAILPEHLIDSAVKDGPPSADYATLSRRFSGFLGLNYKQDVIESGLARARTLSAPYTETNITAANAETFAIARERETMGRRWFTALENSTDEVILQNEIEQPKRGFIPTLFVRASNYLMMRRITHSVMKTFKDLKIINRRAKPIIEKDFKSKIVNIGIERCSQYEKSIFHQAITEAFSPIAEQRYILVKRKRTKPDFRTSFAVPEIFSNKKETAETYRTRMHRRIRHLELYFTRNADGKKILAAARRKAYVNKTGSEITAKMKLRPQ